MDKQTLDIASAVGSIGVMVATFVLAIVTAWMAVATQKMASETKLLQEQENQQRIDNLRPICVLEVNPDLSNISRDLIFKDMRQRQSPRDFYDIWKNDSGSMVFLKCSIHNKGLGPANHVKLVLRIIDKHKDFEQPVLCGVIGAGEQWNRKENTTYPNCTLAVRIGFDGTYNKSDFSGIVGSHWEIFLEYQDMFGNQYHTKYVKADDGFFSGISKGSRPELGSG